jgi:hypothetical protein
MLRPEGALSRILKPKESAMTIEIRDASLEARIRKQLHARGQQRRGSAAPLAGHRKNKTAGS